MSIAQSALLAKTFCFFFYAAQSSLIPFLALYYSQLGFSASQIGFLSGGVAIDHPSERAAVGRIGGRDA